MSDRKARFGVLSRFAKGYQEKTGEKLVFNKYSGQWDADALLESYGNDVNEMIDRYFALSEHPSWKGFCRDAQKIWDGLKIEQEDLAARAKMKARFKEWASE